MQNSLLEQIQKLQIESIEKLASIESEQNAEHLRVHYLGKKGALTQILKEVGKLDPALRPEIGQAVNAFKAFFEQRISEVLAQKKTEWLKQKLAKEKTDLSLPGRFRRLGSAHPITQIMDQLVSFFLRFGFDVETGPEIETDYYNFQALAIPPDHPARDMQDTFYLAQASQNWVLRTHTSPVQIRVMEREKPPIRMIAPGAVYRKDSDVTHTPMFHQIEGLYVDRNVSMAELKGVLEALVEEIFGKSVRLQFRPSYFPFTEPSAEVDISCVFCHGTGCRLCKQSGWLEVMGCGMVDPRVFESVKIDAEIYSGFAFGLGIERIAMLKFGIDDLRRFFENDDRFLRQL